MEKPSSLYPRPFMAHQASGMTGLILNEVWQVSEVYLSE